MRFPEFSGEWEKHTLNELVERVSRKNKDEQSKLALTISAQYGLVDQETFFNKKVASADLSHYYLLKKGDFAYNKSYSTGYPWGAVKRLDLYDEGAVSTLYICFKPKSNLCSDYATHYFESNKWHKGVADIAVEGARNHGLLNVSVVDYFNTEHYIPTYSEQQKIAEFLNLIEQRIATQIGLINKLQSLISGIIQHTIKDGLAKQTWKKVFLSTVLVEHKEPNTNLYSVYSVSVSEGVVNQVEYLGRSFAAKDTSHYHVVKFGDIVYTKSPTGDFPFGIVKQSIVSTPVAVSPLYGVYKPISVDVGLFLHYYFMSSVHANNYLQPLIQKGAKNTINIGNQRFLENVVPLPISIEEIKPLSKTLMAIQQKIDIERLVLIELQKQRLFILSNMFI